MGAAATGVLLGVLVQQLYILLSRQWGCSVPWLVLCGVAKVLAHCYMSLCDHSISPILAPCIRWCVMPVSACCRNHTPLQCPTHIYL